MQIQSVNNFTKPNLNQNPQFKSAYPVVHWVAEKGGGSYAPQITKTIAQEFNENIIRRLNKKKAAIEIEITVLINKIAELTEKIKTARTVREKVAKEKKIEAYRNSLADLQLTKRVKKYISGIDSDYRNTPIARNFYNPDCYFNKNGHEAAVYIVTGKDALELDALGRKIGEARKIGDTIAEEIARSNYRKRGSEIVRERTNNFKLNNGELGELHVKMERLRDIDGTKIGYNISDMKLFPKKGPNNPFALIEWMKN